jgi:putative membrane-bound dehydrogenase-like protein
MSPSRFRAILVGFALVVHQPSLLGQIEPARDAPQPRSTGESLKCFQIPSGFRIELVACEPLLADPTAIAFDERGRLFVCEIHGYNLEGHLDIQELNKTGVLDRKVRRIRANPRVREAARKETFGTVKLLKDRDGDGQMDQVEVWADRLPPCHGIIPSRGGLIVLCAPDILFLADRDGDGKAEVKQTLFTGFEVSVLERSINNPRWGVDNWIYAAGGGGGGRITGPKLAQPVLLGNTDFRFKADGSAIEPVTGRNGTFGLALTDYGDRFLITTSRHALYPSPLPYRYLIRNPYSPSPDTLVDAAGYQRVYPTSKPHPWRVARSKDPAWVRFYGAHEATANGYFTSACGQMIYRANALPESFQGNHFCCDPQQNLIHRSLITRAGAGYQVRRAPGEERQEFLTSTDSWFRPINLATGPEGAIYIVDMYREIIEDYSAIPRYLQQQYGLIKGNERGRIWRLVAKKMPKGEAISLDKASVAELVQGTAHPQAWWRETAQRLLIERGTKEAVALLKEQVHRGPTPQARLHALYTLQGLGSLEPAEILQALGDSGWGVRMHALRLAEPWLDRKDDVLTKVLSLVGDPDPRVRLQVALTLGESQAPRASTALSKLMLEHGSERWMVPALLSSAGGSAQELAEALLLRGEKVGPGGPFLRPLAAVVGSRREDEEVGRLLAAIARAWRKGPKKEVEPLAEACLVGLIEGLQRGKPRMLTSDAGEAALTQLLTSGSIGMRTRVLTIAGLLKLDRTPEVVEGFRELGKQVLDTTMPLPRRRAALQLLAQAPPEILFPAAQKLLDVRQPVEVQLAAVEALAASSDSGVGGILVRGWRGYSPRVQEAILTALFQRQDRVEVLLQALEKKEVALSALDSFRRDQLRNHPRASLAARARKLLGTATREPRRDQQIARYQQALKDRPDRRLGHKLFVEHCSVCHQLEGKGHAVGPDLTGARTRPDETILLDILEPSAQITPGFRTYTVFTNAGRLFAGVLASESATSITLVQEKGARQTILRKNIESLIASEQSLMPTNLGEQLSPRQVADVIAYLRGLLGPVPPPGLVLFDEERDFADLLKDGKGKVRVTGTDRFAGEVSLAVTPPQRYSARIKGWNYSIREKPGPGEFRYLRWAWKARGPGVMLELADAGAWPAANQAVRRYYSGTNTTDWQAVRLSPMSPGTWTVVTVDLWKDFGAFTLTGLAPTAMDGEVLFDRIELLRTLE